MTDVNALLDLAFGDADAAHRQHLASESYAEHMALGDFYDEVRDATDAVVEALAGLGMIPTGNPDILQRLKANFVLLQDMRSVCDGVAPAENLYDNLTAAYLKAIYKLERFRK